jgi:hypothetical protein
VDESSALGVMDKSRPQLEAHGQGWFGGMAAQKSTSILVRLALILSIISLFLQAAQGSCRGRGVINPNYSTSVSRLVSDCCIQQGPVIVLTGCCQLAIVRLPSIHLILLPHV